MKAKTRLLWMKSHAYLSCFFLPLFIIYIVSGVLYLFDVKGNTFQTDSYTINIDSWPIDRDSAEAIVTPLLDKKGYSDLPSDYFPDEANHSWFGYKQEIELKFDESSNKAKITIQQHDFFRKMLLIHKGYAGISFWILGVLIGFSLLFSAISGVIISLQLPQLKSPSMISLALGAATVILLFI